MWLNEPLEVVLLQNKLCFNLTELTYNITSLLWTDSNKDWSTIFHSEDTVFHLYWCKCVLLVPPVLVFACITSDCIVLGNDKLAIKYVRPHSKVVLAADHRYSVPCNSCSFLEIDPSTHYNLPSKTHCSNHNNLPLKSLPRSSPNEPHTFIIWILSMLRDVRVNNKIWSLQSRDDTINSSTGRRKESTAIPTTRKPSKISRSKTPNTDSLAT